MHQDEPIGKIYKGNTEEENNGYESLNENSKDQQGGVTPPTPTPFNCSSRLLDRYLKKKTLLVLTPPRIFASW